MYTYMFVIESVVGIKKPIYYVEMDSCTASVCVDMSEKRVPGGDDGYVHILQYRVTSRYYGMYVALGNNLK